MKHSVLRPLRQASFAFLALIVVGLVASALLTLRESWRLARAQEVFGQLTEFHRVHLLITRRLVRLGQSEDPGSRHELARELDQLETLAIEPDNKKKLDELEHSAEAPAAEPRVVYESMIAIHQVVLKERDSQAARLAQIHREALAHMQIELAIPLAILAAGAMLYPLARRRILEPLDAFGRQLARVGDGDFSPAPEGEGDELLLPLHRQFNQLVKRLAELEEAHEAHERSLEQKVRAATRALLQQQRSLARAERLAATGELAAAVAHELRNPLAGIQMSLQNLRSEAGDGEQGARLERVGAEVERLGRLLNQILDSARHTPEPAQEVDVAALIDDLLALTRHQVPATVRLESRADAGIVCRLPQDQLRQALLNVVLNAAAAVGEAGGRIVVAAEREGTQLRLAVADDGPGLPEELLAGGIRPFFSTRAGGTGLGLAVVRRFARDLGGEVQLANLEPRGARVTLVLPC